MNPTDEQNLTEAYKFGQEAEKVTSNSAYQFAITSLKGDIFQKLVNTPIKGDNDDIVELVRSLQSVEKIHEQLENIMREGTFAKENLLAKDTNKTRFN